MADNKHNTPLSLANLDKWQRAYLEKLMPSPGYYLVNGAIEMFLKEIIRKGAFYLRTPREVLPEILSSKCLKNTFETGTGATMGGASAREQVTHELFGCDTRQFKPSDYPKYGYLSVADPYTELIGNDEMSWHYGNAVFRLNKEVMMHRTTLTVGSSLDFGVSNYMVPTRVDNVIATCLPGLRNGKASKGIADISNLGHYFFMFDSIAKRRITIDNFWRINELLGSEAPSFECFELQYHGPVRLGKEVEELILYPQGDGPYIKALAPQFESLGVKVSIFGE